MTASDDAFDDLDRQIETLHDELDSCRQGLALSRAAIWIGGAILVLVLTVGGAYRTPPIVFGAITAMLGGTVWFGANKASREDAEGRLADAEARKAKLFEQVAARNGWRDLTPTLH